MFFCNGHLISLISQSRRSFSRTNIACFVSTLFAGHTVCSLFWVLDLWTTASSTGPSHLYKRKEQLDWKGVRNERHHGKDKNGTPSHLPSRTNLHAERGVWARTKYEYSVISPLVSWLVFRVGDLYTPYATCASSCCELTKLNLLSLHCR